MNELFQRQLIRVSNYEDSVGKKSFTYQYLLSQIARPTEFIS